MVRKATLDLEVSVSSIQAIRLFRELAEEAGWALERHEGSRLVDRFAIIMPMAQSARTNFLWYQRFKGYLKVYPPPNQILLF